MAKGTAMSLTAPQEILLGAYDLHRKNHDEFSEWDLTVAAWRRNRNLFGCRGYEDKYPDHKRVTMVTMSRQGKSNPIRMGFIERIRPNTYRLTNLGIAEAKQLSQNGSADRQPLPSPQEIYDAVAPLYKSNVFHRHLQDEAEPRMWLGFAVFFRLTSNDALHVEDRINETKGAIQKAIKWLDDSGNSHIRRGVSGGGVAISKGNLLRLEAFCKTLLERFSRQIEAIRKSKK